MFALEKRYNKTYGEDWDKISQISCIWIGRDLIMRELFSSEVLCFLTFPSQLSNRSQDTMASLGELFVRKLPKFANHCQRRGGLNDHCIKHFVFLQEQSSHGGERERFKNYKLC